mgnify:FL=1
MSERDQEQTLKEKLCTKMSHIKGWGVDADPKNDPTYPMRRRFDEDRGGFTWERPLQQPDDEDIFHSNERPDMTRVFGTSAPAHGLSGAIRRCAFRYSEGHFAHWLLLLAADRVNSGEGLVSDFHHGKASQCLSDKGIKALWKYDRKAVLTRAAVGVSLVGMLALVCMRRHVLSGRNPVQQPSHRLIFHAIKLQDIVHKLLRTR